METKMNTIACVLAGLMLVSFAAAAGRNTPVDQAVVTVTGVFDSLGKNEEFQTSKVVHYGTIQAAIDAIPDGNTNWMTLTIKEGVFYEKVNIPATKSKIILQGAGRDKTFISWGDTAATLNGSSILGSAGSATFTVAANDFIAKEITIKNSAPAVVPGTENGQTVAVLAMGDRIFFHGCNIIGSQSTLFDFKGRHYYKQCYIEGAIDFIAGDGQSVFKDCEIHTTVTKQSIGCTGSIAAQSRDSAQSNTGFIFVGGSITGVGKLYLGRAMGVYSRTIFIKTIMSDTICSEGWGDWGDQSRQTTVTFGQCQCTGVGANQAGRVSYSKEFTLEGVQSFLDVSWINAPEWIDGCTGGDFLSNC